MTSAIVFTKRTMASGKSLACIRLNKPKALNALDLEMVQAMHQQLIAWRSDNDIAAVFIDSVGDKAFCAGGDIVSIYQAMLDQKQNAPTTPPDFMAKFFVQEYALDYQLHAYSKPVICWGHGIIMGGGLGIFAAASTKIVTQNVRVAMPEISIGLFPDVGASYFLNKMPPGVGKFLGLTATNINAADCINIGLADYFLQTELKDEFISKLLALKVAEQTNIDVLCADLGLHKVQLPGIEVQDKANVVGNLTEFMHDLAPLESIHSASQAAAFIQDLAQANPNNKILQRAYASLCYGSPVTAHLVMHQMQKGRTLSLLDCFKMELSMAYQCSISGEFQEGVRALLIDKDNQPNWQYSNIESVPEELISAHFNHFVGAKQPHPLANLASDYGEYHAK